MITDEVLAEIPTAYRARMENGSSPEGDEVVEAFELVIELAEELLEWRKIPVIPVWPCAVKDHKPLVMAEAKIGQAVFNTDRKMGYLITGRYGDRLAGIGVLDGGGVGTVFIDSPEGWEVVDE